MRARSRARVVRKVGKAAEAALTAFSVSEALNSGHVPITFPEAGSANHCQFLPCHVYAIFARLTMHLEGLSRVGTHELPIHISLLNEERLIFQLRIPSAVVPIILTKGTTHRRHSMRHRIRSSSGDTSRRKSKGIAKLRTQQLTREGTDDFIHDLSMTA